jgi:hypothetical protein
MMTDRMQYRLRLDDAAGPIRDSYPGERWSQVVAFCNRRGVRATLERRLVTDDGIRGFFERGALPVGYVATGDTVIRPWETFAEFDGRRA